MLRHRFLALGTVGLVLSGCSLIDPAAPDTTPADPPLIASRELPQPTAEVTLEPACPAPDPSATVSAAQLERALDQVELPLWLAADVGLSVGLSDGRIAWFYADTIRPEGYGQRLIGNSLLISSGTCISQVYPADNGPVVPDAATEDEADARAENPFNDIVHWPMSVVRVDPPPDAADDVTDVLIAVYNRVQRGRAAWDFMVRGSTMVTFTVGGDGVPRVDRVLEMTPDDLDPHQITWGAASETEGDWLYIYGTRLTGEAYVYGRELYLSRRPLDDVTNPDRWEFWGGSGWQSDGELVAPVIDARTTGVDPLGRAGVSQTLTVAVIDGRWTAVSKLGGDVYDEIWMWTADSPAGPWEGRPILDVPSGFGTASLTYLPLAHPDVELTSGRLLVTISRNIDDFTRLLEQPQLGRPRYFEVPLT